MEENFERPWSGRMGYCLTSSQQRIYLVNKRCHRDTSLGQCTEGWGKGATA
jgi:hypothetical protein